MVFSYSSSGRCLVRGEALSSSVDGAPDCRRNQQNQIVRFVPCFQQGLSTSDSCANKCVHVYTRMEIKRISGRKKRDEDLVSYISARVKGISMCAAICMAWNQCMEWDIKILRHHFFLPEIQSLILPTCFLQIQKEIESLCRTPLLNVF
jgi:hypothetical protein